MAKPIISFSFTANNLIVIFRPLAIGNVDSWAWDFGASATPQTSTAQFPPAITFNAVGQYPIQLSATNADGTSTLINSIIVLDTPGLNLSILSLIKFSVPPGFELEEMLMEQEIKKWQLYLQPTLDPKILDADVFDESKWPPLANILISKLVIYDLILRAASLSITAANVQNNTGGAGGTVKGAVKKIETGPSNAEWYDGNDFWMNVMGDGGIFQMLINEICMYASRLRISLPMCPKGRTTHIFGVSATIGCGCANKALADYVVSKTTDNGTT